MFLRRIGALAGRIIGQFRHDRRTLALVFVVPLVIMTILNFVLASSESNLKLAIVPPAEPLGTQLVSQIKNAVPDKVTVSTIDSGAVDSTLKAGDADGVLIFPVRLRVASTVWRRGGDAARGGVESGGIGATQAARRAAGDSALTVTRHRWNERASHSGYARHDLSLRRSGIYADRRARAALHRPLRLLLRLSADGGGLPARALTGDAGAADGLANEPDRAGAGLRDAASRSSR